MKNKILSTLLLLFIYSQLLSGQSYNFMHYQVEQGLSNNSVHSILQDSKGFMWFGTKDGLNRFDGYTFKTFRGNPDDSTSIGSNIIQSLYEKDSKIWVGTDKGLYEYDAKSESVKLLDFTANRYIRAIFVDNMENVWFITDHTLNQYNAATQKLKVFHDDRYFTATSICATPDGYLWISSATGSIHKYNPEKDTFQTFNVFEHSAPTSYSWIEKIYNIENHTILIGTQSQGIKVFDIATSTYKDVLPYDEGHSELFVRDFVQNTTGEYWVATESGIYIYNAQKNSFTNLKKNYNNPYSISDNAIYSVYKDREGGIWAGTYFGGVNYYPKQYSSFDKFFPKTGENSLSGNAVRRICQDKYGNLWIGTEDAGLNKYDPRTGEFTNFKPNGEKNSLSHYNIHGLLAIDNELWIGTFHHGLDVMDITTGKIIRHYSAGDQPGLFASNFIYAVYQTRSGKILVGTSEGLYRYNPDSDDFTALPESSDLNAYTTVVLEDDEGTIWGGTFKDGVYFFNPKTKEKGFLKNDPDDKNSISNNAVNSIFLDSKKNLWFATENGLNKYHHQEKKFERYTTDRGLPSNVIYEILEDHENNLWISTSKGLVYLPEDGKLKIFTKAHGLLSDQLNYSSAYKTADGKMYFGSVKGLIGFNPSKFVNNTYIPPVYITGFQVQHKELPVGKKNSPLQNSITYTDEITLNHDQSSFSLDFAALSYTAPEMTEYIYTMEGLDQEWTSLKTNRKVYFTELAPGSYTFKVKASNSSGIWNDKAAQLEIEILPPFWLSKLAYLLYFSLGAIFIYLFIRNYHQQSEKRNKRKIKLLENEKEKEIYQAKIQFFTNVAHEIRSPLTLIKGPLERVIKSTEDLPEVQYNLKTMEKNTMRLLDLTNQLLDFRKTEIKGFSLTFVKADVTNIINETFSRFIPAAEQNDIEFSIELPEEHLLAYVDSEALIKILSNLFSNAIKYAEKKVFVRLLPFTGGDNSFTIIVKNDGFIIPHEMKDKIFEPFFRLEESETKTGTGIGLPLARSLAELHKGTLELDAVEKSLNIFTLTLPVHQENEFNLFNEELEESTELVNVIEEEDQTISKPSILLVDDQKDMLDFLANDLGKEYIVLKAQNGEKALEVLKNETVHLVISDVMMPKIGGFELCKEIKTTLDYSHIPIILLTAKNSLKAKIEGLESGADAYIEKPFSPEHLHVQISNLLMNRNKIKEFFSSSPLAHINTMAYTKADEGFLERLDKAINSNISDTDLNVEHLAEIMNMSKPTLYRKIKALSDLTPNELINIARLKKAAELLKGGDYKMYEVANIVGYNSQTSFGRNFMKQFGMTPSEYAHKDHSVKTVNSGQ